MACAMSLCAALYIHVPFCAHKCGYCDFNSWAETRRAPQEAWLEALKRQVGFWGPRADRAKVRFETVFWGGGTPSLLENDLLVEASKLLSTSFAWSPEAEWTVECNPETLDEAKMDALEAAGFNRLSMGIQSFQDRFLERLERKARRPRNVQALELVGRRWKGRWSLDLMFGLPDQTAAEWQDDLEQALSFGPRHISAYQLTLTTERSKSWQQPQEERLLEMFDWAEERLAAAGLPKYETSNFAEAGHESRHNLKYWRLEPFLGLGPGAAGLLPASLATELLGREAPYGASQKQPDRFENWAQGAGREEAEAKTLTQRRPDEHLLELLMMGLRLQEGLKKERIGWPVQIQKQLFERQQVSGFIKENDDAWLCTPAGARILDSVLQEIAVKTEKISGPNLDSVLLDPKFTET
jgi:putative oxygen-independent coproporphyrinogen III oxidase